MSSMAHKMIVLAGTICCLSLGVYGQRAGAPGKSTSATSTATPRMPDGHPDLSGLWNMGAGQAPAPENGPGAGSSPDLAPSIFAARHAQGRTGDAALINFERDNTILRRMDGNRPQYKPKYWELIKRNDQGGNNEDPGGNCMPPGVPRVGAPTQIVQTATQLVLLYVPEALQDLPPPIASFQSTAAITRISKTWTAHGTESQLAIGRETRW